MATFPRPALDDLIALACEAGREIMEVRDAGVTAIDKADGSPVTLADQRAEALIEAGLRRLAPGAPMVGEEAVAAGRVPEPGEAFFCVDALDGTRDFVAASGEFTVNIALVEHGEPVMGVVLAPAIGELFAGEPGRALKAPCDVRAGRIEAPMPIRVVQPGAPWRVIASRHSGANEATGAFIARLGACEKVAASSSIKFCRLAEGAADLYPRFGQVNEWDIAAGHAILSAAGGGAMSLESAPLRYGANAPDFLVPGFIAFASARAAQAASDALKGMR